MASTVRYHEASKEVRKSLAHLVPQDELKRLHVVSGWRHSVSHSPWSPRTMPV